MAHDFLELCLSQYRDTQDPSLQPTSYTFTAVLSAWSHSKDPHAARKAHDLLDRMKDYGVDPNVYSYSIVLDAYARSNNKKSVDHAMELFRSMKDDAGIEPNVFAYTTIIRALANCGRAPEAEELLNEMLLLKEDSTGVDQGSNKRTRNRRTSKGDDDITPDVYALSSVLNAWAKSHAPDAAERAEDLLIRMHELYDAGIINEPPNLVCYNSVIAGWARSRSHGAAQRADDLLRVMQQRPQQPEPPQRRGRHHHDKSTLRPNLVTYNTVLNAWANDGNWAKVEKLVEELRQLSQDDNRFSPDEWTVRAIWKAMQKGGGLSLVNKHRHMTDIFQIMATIGMKPSGDMRKEYDRLSRMIQSKI